MQHRWVECYHKPFSKAKTLIIGRFSLEINYCWQKQVLWKTVKKEKLTLSKYCKLRIRVGAMCWIFRRCFRGKALGMWKHWRNVHIQVIVFGAKSERNKNYSPMNCWHESLVVNIIRSLIRSKGENKMQILCQIHWEVFKYSFTVSTPFQVQFN